jgi:hypothetical protein
MGEAIIKPIHSDLVGIAWLPACRKPLQAKNALPILGIIEGHDVVPINKVPLIPGPPCCFILKGIVG